MPATPIHPAELAAAGPKNPPQPRLERRLPRSVGAALALFYATLPGVRHGRA